MVRMSNRNITIYFQCIGIALVLVGVPLGMYFNYFFPIIEWSPIFMTLSVLLLTNYKNLVDIKFPSYNKLFGLILGLQIMMLFYNLFASEDTISYFPFHIYIICLIISLSSVNILPIKIHTKQIVYIVFLISCICSILGVYVSVLGIVVGQTAWELKQEFSNYALEPFTVAQGVLINLIACYFLFRPKVSSIIFLIFILLDVYVLFAMTKREPIAIAIIALVLFVFKRYLKVITAETVFRFGGAILLLLFIFLLLYFNIDSIQKTIDNFIFNFTNGLLNILGYTNVSDQTGSGIARFYSREWAYNYINQNFTLVNYIFGKGYNIRWLDSPVLQSFLDMGLIGMFYYTYLIIVFPIKFILKKNIHPFLLFALLLCLSKMLTVIVAGHPYMYSNYTPLCVLAFSLTLTKRKCNALHS